MEKWLKHEDNNLLYFLYMSRPPPHNPPQTSYMTYVFDMLTLTMHSNRSM